MPAERNKARKAYKAGLKDLPKGLCAFPCALRIPLRLSLHMSITYYKCRSHTEERKAKMQEWKAKAQAEREARRQKRKEDKKERKAKRGKDESDSSDSGSSSESEDSDDSE